MKIINLLWFLSIIIILGSCESKKEYLIPENEMIDILVDIHVADGILNTTSYPYDNLQLRPENYYKNVLAKHNITRIEFDSALSQYSRDRKLYISMYEKVIEQLRTKESYIQANAQNTDTLTQDNGGFYYSYFSDFETTANLNKSKHFYITNKESVSGNKSLKVEGKVYAHAYSTIIEEPIKEIEFDFTCFVKFKEVLRDYPSIAFILEKDDKILSVQYVKLDQFVKQKTKWKQVTISVNLSLKTPMRNVKVSTYFFNKKKAIFYVDDYSLKIKQVK